MKKQLKLLGIAGLLLLVTSACQREEGLITESTLDEGIYERVNLSEAKELFYQVEKGKLEKRKVNKNGYFLALTPNWGSFEQNKDLTDKNYSKVETTLFESNVKGEILFVKENDSIKQFLFMTRIDSVSAKGEIYNARLYFFETTGELVDAYKMENQIITKRWGVTQQKGLTARGVSECGRIHKKIVSEIDDWEIGCNRGGGGNNPWGPNPFTFDGVNELYEVTVTAERWNPFGDKDLLFINQIYTRATQNHHQADAFENNRNLSGVGGTIIRGYIAKRKLDSKDHIIDELKNPCAKDLLKQLPNLKNDIAKLLKETFGGDSKYDITFTEDEKLRGTNIDGQADAPNATKISEDEIIFRGNIYLNPDILENATQEYILVTMYHEVVHAFLNYEQTRLRGELLPNEKYDNSEFERKYPGVKEIEVEYGNKNKVKKYQLLQEQGHNRFAPFIEKLAQSIISFNPKIPLKTARAMAKMGIVDEKSMSNEEKQLSGYQRKGTDPKGTKCN
ncbi:hypothetical protein [Capnocytophaga canis]|uniref:hypothetical protein n=2 Tax=Capnocytophaga canis TaxID=1848903 RepID=UPI003858C39F